MRRIVFSCLCAAGLATSVAASAQTVAPAAPAQTSTPVTSEPTAPPVTSGTSEPTAPPATSVTSEPTAPPASQPSAAKAETPETTYPGLTTSTEQAAELAWPGSFAIPGTTSRLKISGFAEFDAMYDNNAILTPTSFVTSSIVTHDATPAQGKDGQLNFSTQPTRLNFEWRIPLSAEQRVKAFLAIDLFGNNTSASNSLRVREAYGEVTKILFGGDLLLGQTWSIFRNTLAIPSTLDFQTPPATFGVRHPQARWTRKLGSSPLTLKVGVEAADKRSYENAVPLTLLPDAAAALLWETEGVNVQGSVVLRQLRASVDDGSPIAAFGWGASIAGRIYMPAALEGDFVTFGATYGRGIGSLLNDAPADATYDEGADKLKPLISFAYYASYQHWWNTSLYSVFAYSDVWQDTYAFQAPTAFEHTRYISLNLSFTPSPSWLFGVEGLYGSREDRNDDSGWVARGQFTSRFIF